MPSEVMVESMESNGGNVENTEQHHHLPVSDPHGLMGKKLSWQKFPRNDSLDMESRSFPTSSHASIMPVIMHLAFQSLGIVYGDMGTSPLYVYASTFVDGIKHNDDILGAVVGISIAILICLFMVQRFGTDKVGYSFAPIIYYFRRNKKDAWISLGGVVLSITGTEALFADVGHFTVRSMQISMCSVTYPALLLAYTGQASFLRQNNDLVSDTFYKSIPRNSISPPKAVFFYSIRIENISLYWPMFVVAVMASIIASQAMISGTFSIIQQSLALGCFPCVKIVHTSAKYEGQVYIPEINFILLIACVAVTAGFKTTTKIGNA
ncbi:Potassium transporter 5 [Glycine soja]